jgi:hypothetical protein
MNFTTIDIIEVEYEFNKGSRYSHTQEPVSPSVTIKATTIDGIDAQLWIEANASDDDHDELVSILNSIEDKVLDQHIRRM